MTLKRRFFSAPTLTQALLAAARHHSATPDTIEYKVIDKKQGFIKAPRGVVIEVDPDAPTNAATAAETPAPVVAEDASQPVLQAAVPAPTGRETEVSFEPAGGEGPAEHPALAPVDSDTDPAVQEAEPEAAAQAESALDEQPASDAPAEPRPAEEEAPAVDRAPSPVEPAVDPPREESAPASPETSPLGAELAIGDAELQEAVAEAIDELAFLASLRVQVASVKAGDDGLEVELEGPDSPRLAARDGRALLAMQHLLPRLLFGKLGKALRCHVDCDNFHVARSERLERLAQKAADRVRSGGRSWLLDPMAPDERRLVHMALSEVQDIETESVGEGFLKRVRVAQVDAGQSS